MECVLGKEATCTWHAEPHLFCVQGIDLEAGGRNKKTWRTAPKSENVYLKLLVKVRTAALFKLLWLKFPLRQDLSPYWLSSTNALLVDQ